MTDLPDREIYLPDGFTDPHVYLESLISFTSKFDRLINMHIVNFITDHQWELLDPTWRQALLPSNAEDYDWITPLVHVASANTSAENWPQSLKDYVEAAKNLALPRVPLTGYNSKCTLDKWLLRGMTDKKRHEVEPMSTIVKRVADRRDLTSVMDLGAGQGYLSRTLAYRHNLHVLAVDGSEVQTCGAKRFDKHALKLRPDLKLDHVTDMVTPENVSTILAKWSKKEEHEKWLVCGLHACGDLSSLMLRLFVSSDDIAALVNVGCCYHFLTEEPYGSAGFPMSNFLTRQTYRMGSTACMLACQTPSRWSDKREETLVSFEHHFFRALLQHVMVEKGLAEAGDPPILGRLNKKFFVSFPVYVQAALQRLKLPESAITTEEAEAYYAEYKAKQIDKQIAVLWTIRALLAPVHESIVLTDRWLYLKESLDNEPSTPTKGVWMWPIFEPLTSPRNMVLVASK
ncbi:methyltransferase domain-containing protein [Fennellomyces sp. T-0311]|nr:methyltransferase domain-containing protein [Fennellomyces sp. T-0311]